MNRVEEARIAGVGDRVAIEAKAYDDADDLVRKTNNVMIEADASKLQIRDAVVNSAAKLGGKDAYSLAKNPFINSLTGGDIRNNLFLADDNSTPVAALNKGKGLETSAVNITSYGQAAKVLKNIPYKVMPDGRKAIAWQEMEKHLAWSKEYRNVYDEVLTNAKKRNPSINRLTAEQRKEVIAQTDKNMGYNLAYDPSIKTGDIVMFPIVVVDKGRTMGDADVSGVMQSNVSGEEQQLVENLGFELDKHIKRTFAFTVLDDGPSTLGRGAYGPDMDIKDDVNIKDLLEHTKRAQQLNESGYNFLDLVIQNSSISAEKTKE
jgi:hypothetical protein